MAAKAYLRGEFRKDYAKDPTTAMMNLSDLIDKAEQMNAKLNFRFAYVSCRQLLERIAESVQAAHQQKDRDSSCTGVNTGSTTQALIHLKKCTMVNEHLRQWMKHPTNKEMEPLTAKYVFDRTSALIHNEIYVKDNILLIPYTLSRTEMDFMAIVAMHNRIAVKVITDDGSDVTASHLSREQRALITDRSKIEHEEMLLPENE